MAATFLTPPTSAAYGGALDKRNVYLSLLCLIIVTLWTTSCVMAAPAKLDTIDPTFPLDLQPPIFEATESASASASGSGSASASSQRNGNNDGITIDSYGNPIGSLQPIETPDGRKVVSAQGLQFEIPNYASGITELKKPADDLLPPFIDPIVVSLPNASPESFSTNAGPTSLGESTSIDVESVPLVEVAMHRVADHDTTAPVVNSLPDYILELNDPDIAGAVAYEPSDDMRVLKVIAWDLLPPLAVEEENSDKSNSHNNKGRQTTNQSSKESSHTIQKSQISSRSSEVTTTPPNNHRGQVSYTSSTELLTTPTTTTTRKPTTPRTTAAPSTTTTPRTTTVTTRRTTTPRTTTAATTTNAPDSEEEFYKLEAGDSYTLPPWLQDIDDPDLDVAVAYIIPEDINEYNHTIDRDLVPPLEPYTDLNNLHFTPSPKHKEAATTPRTTTTTTTTTATAAIKTTAPRTTTTTTSTVRPHIPSTASTAQPHWVRARPTSPKPTITTFSNQFTGLSPSTPSTYFAQRTTSTTTTTTVKPKPSLNFHNQQFSSNTPQTDQIGSGGEEANSKFLHAYNDGKYKPQATTRRTTTTTTTTTTTPSPEIIEKNPFEPTLPPWLKDFDYPDVGPGVPFVYNPNEDESLVDKNILPPSKSEDSNKSNLSSNSPLLNSQTPQGFTNKFTSSAIPLTTSTPSIVTNPLPSIQTNQDDRKITRPPPVFAAAQTTSAEGIIEADKSDDISKKTSSTFNQNFAAPFGPATGTISTNVAADRESFPPFNSAITGPTVTSSKTTFTKSEDGKVITNIGSTSAKTIGGSTEAVSNQERTTFTSQSATGSSFTKSTTSAAVAGTGSVTVSGSSTFGSSFSSNGAKYTGRFGGPPGVLAPQDTAVTASSSTVTNPTFTDFAAKSSSGLAANNNDKFKGSFGGPPGVLKPYDNVKNR